MGGNSPQGPGTPTWGDGESCAWAQEGFARGGSPQGPGMPASGDGESCPGAGGCSGGPAGGSSPQGPGTPAWGDGESCPSGGRCSRRARWGRQSPRPGHTTLGGMGSPAQAVVGGEGGPVWDNSPLGPGTPNWGDGESCPSGGRCSRRACEGQQLPRPGHASLGGRGILPGRGWVLKEGLRGAAVPKSRAHQPRGVGNPAQAVVGAEGGPAGGSSPWGQ